MFTRKVYSFFSFGIASNGKGDEKKYEFYKKPEIHIKKKITKYT